MPRCARRARRSGSISGRSRTWVSSTTAGSATRATGRVPSFVFFAGRTPPELRPDGWETEAAYWISLAHLRRDANRTIVPWDTRRMPGIRYLDQVIWGLTLWVFQSFESVVRTGVRTDL